MCFAEFDFISFGRNRFSDDCYLNLVMWMNVELVLFEDQISIAFNKFIKQLVGFAILFPFLVKIFGNLSHNRIFTIYLVEYVTNRPQKSKCTSPVDPP